MDGWQVIKTARFKEAVRQQLTDFARKVCLPMMNMSKQFLRPSQARHEPLFPGYLFEPVASPARFLPLRHIKAFRSVICFGGSPAYVGKLAIDDLKRNPVVAATQLTPTLAAAAAV